MPRYPAEFMLSPSPGPLANVFLLPPFGFSSL
jgi:hypothetical protein